MNESDEYWRALEEAKAFHKSNKTYSGSLLRPHAPFIKEIIDRLDCKTLLDFGAGKGKQYEWVMPLHQKTIEEWWGIPVTKYDPAWPPFASEPDGVFDIVICTHTLGAIPAGDHVNVINRIISLASKAVYFAEKLGSPKKAIHTQQTMTAEQWKARIWRSCDIEITLALKERTPEGVMSEYWRLIKGDWVPIIWPPEVKALNHKWA